MAKNKKKVSTPSKKALFELEKEFLLREKFYESNLAFLNNSDTIKGFISQETFEKTFKKIKVVGYGTAINQSGDNYRNYIK